VSLLMVLAAAQTSSSASEAPLGTAAHSKAGAVTLAPTAATTVSLNLEPAVLPPTSRPTASVARMAKFASTLALAIAAPALDGAAARRTTAVLDARLASAIVLSPTLETCLLTAPAGRLERLARAAHTENAVLPMITVARVMASVLLAASPDSETALPRPVSLPMVAVVPTASPVEEAHSETVVLHKVTAERTTIAVQDVRLCSALAMQTLVPSLPMVAAAASTASPARAAPLETVAPQAAGAASGQSTATLVVKPSSAIVTAKLARFPPTVVAGASMARFAKEVLSGIVVRPKATVVFTITAMRAVKLPSVPVRAAPTTSLRTGAAARTEKPARAALSGTVALSMDGVEKEMTSVAMDASWLTAFAPASLLIRNVDPGTGGLVPDLV
jgi:hypothetical protein